MDLKSGCFQRIDCRLMIDIGEIDVVHTENDIMKSKDEHRRVIDSPMDSFLTLIFHRWQRDLHQSLV